MTKWLLLAVMAGSVEAQAPSDPRAVIRRAVDVVGGEAALRGIARVSLKMMTQWQRTTFRDVPFVDRPSFEPHTDVRDYTIPAWRNTREFGTRRIINVIRDSVAITDLGQGFQPLSVAYVDERAELFVLTPDRLLLALLDAPDPRPGADTTIGGEAHRRVGATLAGKFPATVFFHRGTGLPTLLRFRAGHPNDFGLVPWGVMSVEVWYSGWTSVDGIGLATQWDVVRFGIPYKRMTVLRAAFNPTFESDSFAVTPEQRAAYLASSAVRPMHESVPIREPRLVAPTLAMIGAFGVPSGAVRTGASWLLLGAGHTGFNYGQGIRILDSLGATPIGAVLAASASTSHGGLVVALDRGLPVYVSAASEPFVRRVLLNAGRRVAGLRRVTAATVLGEGDHQVRLEPIDLPNTPGSLILHQPSTGWLYVPDAESPLDLAVARARAAALGWTVKAVGTARNFHQPAGG